VGTPSGCLSDYNKGESIRCIVDVVQGPSCLCDDGCVDGAAQKRGCRDAETKEAGLRAAHSCTFDLRLRRAWLARYVRWSCREAISARNVSACNASQNPIHNGALLLEKNM
jgi:hypothetical protein